MQITGHLDSSIRYQMKHFGVSEKLEQIIRLKDFFNSFVMSLNLEYDAKLHVENSSSVHCGEIVSASFRIYNDKFTYRDWNRLPFWIMFPFNDKIRVILSEEYCQPYRFDDDIWRYVSFENEQEFMKKLYYDKPIGSRDIPFHFPSINELNKFLLQTKHFYINEESS